MTKEREKELVTLLMEHTQKHNDAKKAVTAVLQKGLATKEEMVVAVWLHKFRKKAF